MTRILVLESNHRTLEALMDILPTGFEVHGADATDTAKEILAESATNQEPFDALVIQGAAQDGKVGTGSIDITLDFLREVHKAFGASSLKVFVVSGMFDHGPAVAKYQAAYPGSQVFNKNAVLNGSAQLPV